MHGQVYSGTTTVTLNGASSATVVNCPGTTAASACTSTPLDITAKPIIYVQNTAGCSLSPYSPYDVSYPTTTIGSNYYGCEGDVYVKGNYSASFTIAAANDIVVTGDLTTAHDGSGNPTGPAVLGLVANKFVRVMHGVTPRQNHGYQQCQAKTWRRQRQQHHQSDADQPDDRRGDPGGAALRGSSTISTAGQNC